MNWIQKQFVILLAKVVKGKLGLKEDKEMNETKKWYQSKTNIAAIVGLILSVYQIASVGLAPIFGWAMPPIPDWIITAIGAVVISLVYRFCFRG
jgi:hypothetical protein